MQTVNNRIKRRPVARGLANASVHHQLVNRRFVKSKKAATSNWANPQLTPAQLVYAANDAWAAIRVYDSLGLA